MVAETDIAPSPDTLGVLAPRGPIRAWLQPHRIMLIIFALGLLLLMALTMRWDWLPHYAGELLTGLWRTVWMLVGSVLLGFMLAVPLGLVQVTGPRLLSWPARAFCTTIRGTPLLLQIWLLYYGLGSLFPMFPELRQSFLWPYLREGWPYGLFALTMSFAGYEGEVMRGAFAGVPGGELEAARACGMAPFTTLRRIWLPRAFYRALPTLGGEVLLQLKSTPLIATITVLDLYGVVSRIREETYLTYEPLLFLALIYMCLTAILVIMVRTIERRVPTAGV